MSAHVVDALSRHAAGISRRGSLLSLGAAGMAALAHSVAGEAKNKNKKKSGKKDRKKCKNKTSQQEADRCLEQVQPCADFITALCAGDPECLGQTSCCAFLGSCEAFTFLTCIANQS